MAEPTRSGYSVTNPGGSATALVMNPAASPVGSAVAAGDLMFVVIAATVTTTSMTPPSGWTQVVAPVVTGTEYSAVWMKTRVAGETSYSFAVNTAGATAGGVIFWISNPDPTLAHAIIGAFTNRNTSGGAFANWAETLTTTTADNLVLVISSERTTNATATPTISGATPWFRMAESGSQIQTIDVAYIDKAVAGATGRVTITYNQTQPANGWAIQIAIPPIPGTAAPTPGFNTSVVGQVLSVTSTATPASGRTIVSTDYNWGDSTTHGNTANATHTYAAAGTYTVTQTVTDDLGTTASIPHSVTIAPIGLAGSYVDLSGVLHAGYLFYNDASNVHHGLEVPKFIYKPYTVSEALSARSSLRPWQSLHRGGSYNYPEEVIDGYRACAQQGAKMLEISVWRSADGTFWCFHDSTTTRTTGVTGTISAMTDAQISVLSNLGSTAAGNPTQPSRPVAKLVDVINLYYKTHVLVVEAKNGATAEKTALLDLLDSYGTSGRPAKEIFIWKADALGAASTFFTPAQARGYVTWAYIFDASMASSYTATLAKTNMVGLDYNSSDATLAAAVAQALAAGVMPTGHIIPSTTIRDRMLGLGMQGLMYSNIRAIQRRQ